MISVFNYDDSRLFISDRFLEMPKKGYGQSYRLAQYLGVHTSLISQVVKGRKSFSLEQAQKITTYFGLLEKEVEYFLLLVQKEKAGTVELKNIFDRKLKSLKKEASLLVNRLQASGKLDEATRAIFYSHWKYSAVRQLTALPQFPNLDAIGAALGLSVKATNEVMAFLLRTGLCVEKEGRFVIGPSSTHLEIGSPWAYGNLANWRQKALEEFRRESPAKLHYTAPMTLSKGDAEKVRELIIKFLEEVDRIVEPSPSEALHCLNIDWFGIT